jgi:arylsulfatase A-like enzyme
MSLILVVADSLRHDALGCTHQSDAVSRSHRIEPAKTPTIDALAAEGVLFERAITAAPWTVPSLGSMMTGVFSHRLGLAKWEQPFPSEFATLFYQAQNSGSVVASFVFDTTHLFRRVPEAGVCGSSQDVSSVLQWVREHRDEQYLLFIHYWWTHVPYVAKPMDINAWRIVSNQVLGTLRKSPTTRGGVQRLYRHAVGQFSEDFLPRVLDAANLDTTWVAVTSDHGESWGEREQSARLRDVFDLHGTNLYEEALRIPLVIRPPGGTAGRRVAQLVRSVDFAPTFATLLGASLPAANDIDGVDLAATVLRDAPVPSLEALSVASRDFVDAPELPEDPRDLYQAFALTTERYKLIQELAPDRRLAFDLVGDPAEQHDLSGDPESAERLRASWTRLADEIERARIGDWLPQDAHALKQRLRELGYLE